MALATTGLVRLEQILIVAMKLASISSFMESLTHSSGSPRTVRCTLSARQGRIVAVVIPYRVLGSSSLELPDDFELIVRGASREVLGEATCARTCRGVLTIVPLDPVWHEEAGTSVVYAALQHATKDETVAVLMCTQDNDSLLAAQAGFAEAIDAAGGQGSAVAAAAKKVHLQMKGWWLTPEGKRVLGR